MFRQAQAAFPVAKRAGLQNNEGVTGSPASAMLPALFLIPLVALLRIFLAWSPGGTFSSTGLSGACPMSAVALCAGLFLPRRLALAVPLGVLLLSDLAIFAHYGYWNEFLSTAVPRYALLVGLGLAGLALRRGRWGRGIFPTLLATAAGSTAFYVATNTLEWLKFPQYSVGVGGWWQSLTTGLPGYVPSYVFYRNGLVSDLLYSMMFVACVRLSVRPRDVVNPDAGLADARRATRDTKVEGGRRGAVEKCS